MPPATWPDAALPGIMHLLQSGLVSDSRIIGVSLDDFDDHAFREFAGEAYREFSTRAIDEQQWAEFALELSYVNVKAGPEALATAAAGLGGRASGESPDDCTT
ncbi:hypothetical protein [Aeromicrobium sp. UC242_57]|uniref:hypothetical protein n=1 Tax=Aeromicrobium sp. UC242_57 TaxID=3374624 RepID=UPI0037ADBC7F